MDLLLHRSDQAGSISYQITTDPQRVSGVSQLVQEIIVELLSDYDPVTGRGSDLQQDLAGTASGSTGVAQSAAARAIGAVKGTILRRQQRNPGLTGQERLSDLRLLSIVQAPSGAWAIEIQLTPATGTASSVLIDNVEL